MASSTFHPKPIINNNYEPLKQQHPSLQYYFREAFILMDNMTQPTLILASLLEKYLSFNKMNSGFGRTIREQTFAQKIKTQLDHPSLVDGLIQAIRVINESSERINPKDDLMWLLSVYFSLFPFLYRELTHSHIKTALTICDINNIYFQTILERWLAHRVERNVLYMDQQTIEIAYVTNQYESFLKKMMDNLNDDDIRSLSFSMKELVKYATVDQVEDIIVMPVMSYLRSENADQYSVLKYLLPFIVDKLSEKTLETQIVPEVINLLKQQVISSSTGKLLLICIDKMRPEAIKRCIQPVLVPYFFSDISSTHRYKVLKPFLAMMSRLSQEENDSLSKKLISTVNRDWDYKILSFLKKLRKEQWYVNEDLFQAMNESINQKINAALADLEKNFYYPAYPKHLNAEQVERYFYSFSLATVYQSSHRGALLNALQKLTKLPLDVYPMSLRKKVFEFLWDQRDDDASNDKRYVSTLIYYLKAHEFSDATSRKILIEHCLFAMKKMVGANFDGVLCDMHGKLLETCASLMTEQELKDHVVPMINLEKINAGNTAYMRVMHETFKQVFSRVNDPYLYAQFFPCFLQSYRRNRHTIKVEEILPLIIERFNPALQIYTCRHLLKSEYGDFGLDDVVSVFAWFYKHNSESLHLSQFCTAHHHPSIELSNRIEGRWVPPVPESKCSMM